MEVDERPTEQYSDIGGLDKQIQELIEAVVLPVTHKERFENLGQLVCESERDRQTDTNREKARETETQRERMIQTERQTDQKQTETDKT